MSDRRMIYPYSTMAKLRNFPLGYFLKFPNHLQGVVIGFFLSLPLFYKLQKISLSEENYKNKAEARKREAEEIAVHQEHLM